MFCFKCGMQINEDSKFCSFCGTPLKYGFQNSDLNEDVEKNNCNSNNIINSGTINANNLIAQGSTNREKIANIIFIGLSIVFFIMSISSIIEKDLSLCAITTLAWISILLLYFRFYKKMSIVTTMLIAGGVALFGIAVNHLVFRDFLRGVIDFMVAILILMIGVDEAKKSIDSQNKQLYDNYDTPREALIKVQQESNLKQVFIIILIALTSLVITAIISIPYANRVIKEEQQIANQIITQESENNENNKQKNITKSSDTTEDNKAETAGKKTVNPYLTMFVAIILLSISARIVYKTLTGQESILDFILEIWDHFF